MNKETRAWILYDWANSVFALTVMAAFFPIMFKKVWGANLNPSLTTTYLAYGNSIAGIMVAIISPILATVIAAKGGRKSSLIFWALIGIGATATLAFLPSGEWFIPLVIFIIARVGFQFANLFYDSLLPIISVPNHRHRISSIGFSAGYLGCGLLFIINILLVLFPEKFGLDGKVSALRVSIFLAAIWWFIFSIPLLKSKIKEEEKGSKRRTISEHLLRLKETIKFSFRDKNITLFLLAYWFYIDGVHTIVVMAVDFALSINLPSHMLLIALLVVQVVAFPSALILNKVAQKWGVKPVISGAVIVYTIISFAGALFMKTGAHFIFFAGLTGTVQGGVQALSRSLFSIIIPKERSTELFGIYNMVGKFSMILGPILIGTVNLILVKNFGSEIAVRMGFASLSILFVTGLILFQRVSITQSSEQ
jgi:UMF1 family MFS transporter